MKARVLLVFVVLGLAGCAPPARSGQSNGSGSTGTNSKTSNITFSVGSDIALNYPKNLPVLPDEHTTFIPTGPGSYLVFAASGVTGDPLGAGVAVLQTSDLVNFTFAQGYTSPVMSAALPFKGCKSSFDPEFDLNYAAPGTVVQDPTLPAGNLIIVYEAENHCPGAVWQQPFYVTVGIARSSDNGKTWPQPVDRELGGPDRYPVLKLSVPEPTTAEQPPVPMGDALPSAYVDGRYLYVSYSDVRRGTDGVVRVARAQLGAPGQLSFSKWYNGSFSQPGMMGQDSGVLPQGACQGREYNAQISYNDALKEYLMTFVCISSKPNSSGQVEPYQAGWYFSTATSLDAQNWTAPQLIENSQRPVTHACGYDGSGGSFDGWYPSFVSPGAAAGHTSLSGKVFFLNGCDTGARMFSSRSFTITGGTP